ncbi:MAG: 1-acyl-sn-glycerol-3-phosphate acyltransferase [Candidatus Krumholzibacteria bacterium]|jgi:1-acyl-sn-glycerol-3-phosphate acyltransferase|nr:1-acyl-sn-glycerol-3-phosphate acyltransferase [Candidatus Krumholzibacteria bacterium]MDP6668971.1 1-acyl-sn-glycerol-3-phosphate acyltransferase [Candidatus Krumholzibacteria bacterium]MDP6796442.1 1-acyl-sn-glycerol-3-phosphate acyltransferase [Candidatus Krumholzibacteria bacterium]MDP7022449.1 1-acyl-sn-glycerol-3-phosphate acyltransferase [Candidatus Krumholzibacteria bacterium]
MLAPRVIVQRLLLRPLLRFIFGINALGRENLEGLEQFILIANHNSHLDTLILFSVLPAEMIEKTHPVAARDYFCKNRLLFTLVDRLFRPLWVDRSGSGNLESMQTMLDAGKSLLLFPEGSRGEAGEIAHFRSGIGHLSTANPELPVVTAFLEGPERAFPRGMPFPLPLWNHITFGPPQVMQGEARQITARLEKDLRQLAEEEMACRQRRPSRAKPRTVALLGIDGSGKSSLSRSLAEEFSADQTTCLISDRLEFFEEGKSSPLQPLLVEKVRRWVSRHAKQAGSLKSYKVPKLAELLLRDRLLGEVERWYRPGGIFLDGSPLYNMTAWAALYREDFFTEEVCAKALKALSGERLSPSDPIYANFPELKALERLGLSRLHQSDAVIFLDVDPAVCVDRIHARGEKQQVHETVEKLSTLREAYRLVCRVLETRIPVRVLSGDRKLEDNLAEAEDFLRQLERNGDES